MPLTLCTSRLLLRPLQESDGADFVRLYQTSHDHFAPWSPLRKPGQTLDEYFIDELERMRRVEGDGSGLRRAAVLIGSDGLAGSTRLGAPHHPGEQGHPAIAAFVNLNNIVRGVFECADMGWRVGAAFTNRGLGTEAVTGMLDLAFAPPPAGLGLHRVQANIIPGNFPSLRLAANAGFRQEGLAKSMLKIAGRWQDHLMHAKLAEEHKLVFLEQQ
jgi:ribosomal-protein-alanine N-acetyltransferase